MDGMIISQRQTITKFTSQTTTQLCHTSITRVSRVWIQTSPMDTNQMSTTITITMTFRAQIRTGLAIAIIRASNTRQTISRALIQRAHQTRAIIIIISGGPSFNSSNNNNSHSIKAHQLQMVRFIIIIIIRIDTGYIFSITREDPFIHLFLLKEIKIIKKKEKEKENMHIRVTFSLSYYKYIYSSEIPRGVRNGKFVILTPLKIKST